MALPASCLLWDVAGSEVNQNYLEAVNVSHFLGCHFLSFFLSIHESPASLCLYFNMHVTPLIFFPGFQ